MTYSSNSYSRPASPGGRSAGGRGSFRGTGSGPSRGGSSSYGGGSSRPGLTRFGHPQSRPPFRGSRGGGRNAQQGQRIDPSRFINKAVIQETEVFVPQHNFIDFEITDSLKKNIVAKGYVTPTPIQDRAIPHVINGQDVVGIANTGTGKTAAFLIPLINKVLQDRTKKVLIMVPTRELARQIETEFWGFAKLLQVNAVTLVGGANINPQIATLRRNPNFVIGTPGRIKDIMERRALDLSKFSTVVLDEADRMLDMGFIHDMKFIMSKMIADRHTLFFSATLSREIEMLIGSFLKNPVRISVKTGDTAQSVDQDVVRVDRSRNKLDVLHDLLIQPEFSKVLIFGRTKHGVEKLSQMLASRGFKAESIHGDKRQSARERSLAAFKQNRAQILVATDVAARGIDVENVSHVINYDLPMTYEDYVHRIGRTGRAGKKGKALTFVD